MNYNKLHSKSAQTVILSYIFYLVLSLFILIGTFYYTDSIEDEIKLMQEVEDVSSEAQHLYIQHLEVLSKKGRVNLTHSNTNYSLTIITNNQWSAFQNADIAFFYKHQLPFCQNYSIFVERLKTISINESDNCIMYTTIE